MPERGREGERGRKGRTALRLVLLLTGAIQGFGKKKGGGFGKGLSGRLGWEEDPLRL